MSLSDYYSCVITLRANLACNLILGQDGCLVVPTPEVRLALEGSAMANRHSILCCRNRDVFSCVDEIDSLALPRTSIAT